MRNRDFRIVGGRNAVVFFNEFTVGGWDYEWGFLDEVFFHFIFATKAQSR